MRSRRTQGIAISATIAVGILVILLAANLDPYDRQCAWVFPKIASCLLSARETLVAGLIATGGALFAAWLAWSGLQDQIGMARKNERDAKLLECEKKLQDAGRELDLMRTAYGFVRALADAFPKIGDPDASKTAFTMRILDLRRRGGLHISLNAADAPDGNGKSVATVIGRLNALADNLNEATKDLSADVSSGILRDRESEVISHVEALDQLAKLLFNKIPRYQMKFDDAAARKADLLASA